MTSIHLSNHMKLMHNKNIQPWSRSEKIDIEEELESDNNGEQ